MKLFTRQALVVALVSGGAILSGHSPVPLRTPSLPSIFAAERQGDLHGTWILNKELGSDPIGELETRRPGRPVGAGGMGGPGAGGGLGGPLIGGRRRIDRADAEEMARVKEMLRLTMAAPTKITITTEDSVIEVAGDDGTVLRLRPDGKKVPDRTYAGLELERKTKWDGEVLVTEFELKDSEAKARQTWTRTGTQLKVFTKLTPPHGAEPLEVRRAYDLEESPAP
jgi:hypothetical protein